MIHTLNDSDVKYISNPTEDYTTSKNTQVVNGSYIQYMCFHNVWEEKRSKIFSTRVLKNSAVLQVQASSDTCTV